MSEKNTMTRNAVLFLPAKMLEGVLLLMVSSLYTRIFMDTAFSDYGYVNMTVNYAHLLTATWMSLGNTRYVAAEYQKDKAAGLFSTTSIIYALICGIACAVCLIGGLATGNVLFLWGAVMFCTYTAFTILNNTMVQLGFIRPAIVLSLTSASLKLLLAFLFVGGRSNYPTAVPALLANIAADGIGAIGAVFVLGMPRVVRLRSFSKDLLKMLLAFGVPLMGVSLCTGTLNMIDRYLIYGFLDKQAFAVYYANSSIPSSVFNMLSVAVLRGVYPSVLKAWRESGPEEARSLLGAGVRLYMLIGFPAAFGLAAVSLPFSRIFFEKGYEVGAPVIAIIAFAMVFTNLTEYANKGFELVQNTKPVMVNSILATLIKIAVSVVLLMQFGFVGGAVGSLIAFAAYFAISCVRARRYLMWHVPGKTIARIAGSAALCGAAAYGCTLLPLSDLVRLVLAVAAGGAVYVVCILASGEAKEEIHAVKSRLRR